MRLPEGLPREGAKGQALYEKVAQSKFLLGDSKETQQSPDP
jgi:hypothetical protein